jgi:glyoxylase I family protein
MERVVGIGGLFFRAKDPAALAQWYEEHLGVAKTPTEEGAEVWQQESGPTVFAPFPQATDYFGNEKNAWMVNFRVRDLDAMTAQLRAAGITVDVDEQVSSIGRFARVYDPEGNAVELWQP